MGTQERRERERHERRTKILDAARELFAKEGIEAVSMRRIAERIEYSPTALYLHFPDKESLFRELCRSDFAGLALHLNELAPVRDPLERIRRMGEAYVRFAVEHPNHYRFMFMTEHPDVPLDDQQQCTKGDPEKDAYAFLRASCAEAIAAGQVRDDLHDADLLAQTLWAGVHGVAALCIDRKESWIQMHDPDVLATHMTQALMRGIRREGAAAPGAADAHAGKAPPVAAAKTGGPVRKSPRSSRSPRPRP
jgi:AcrR family transcriptional regulator